MFIGRWEIDDAITFYANTTKIDTGVATDADSVPTYRVYEDETGTPLLTGSMALLDSANTAGFYSEQITLSAANGFEAGKCYAIYIAATVNSVAGAAHRTFQVEAALATAAALATVDGIVDDILLDTAEIGAAGAGLTAINLPNQTMDIVGSITGNLSGSVGSVTGAVGSVTGAVGSVTGNVGGSVASVTAEVTVAEASKTGYRLSATGVDDILDELVDGVRTLRELARGWTAALLGKLSGAATTNVKARDIADSKDVIDATVDADGNRTAVTVDLS